jgi:hypothetical protein
MMYAPEMTTPERDSPPIDRDDLDPPSASITGKDVYDTVTDTVTGIDLHASDNLVQLVCVIVGAGIGALSGGLGWGGIGSMIGAVVGVVASLLLSGLAIGLYRLIKRLGG